MATKALSVTAEEVLPRNKLRSSWIIQNEDSAIGCFLKKERTATPTVSSTDHDHRLGPGSSLALNLLIDGAESVQDRWTIVAASGTPRVSFFETESVSRAD